jgi:hypothetical protein
LRAFMPNTLPYSTGQRMGKITQFDRSLGSASVKLG